MVSRWQRRGERERERYASFDTIKLFGPWSGGKNGLFCRSELKIHVMTAFKAKYDHDVVSIVGLRREESSNRAATKICAPNSYMGKRGHRHRAVMWHPIAAWSTEDVFAHHAENGIPLHEAYSLGSSRLSCAYCVLASLHDLSVAADAEQNQELYRIQVGIEAASGFSFQPTRGLVTSHLTFWTPSSPMSLDEPRHAPRGAARSRGESLPK